MNGADLIACEAVIAAGLPALEPTNPDHFAKCLRVLLAALPKRNQDDLSGELLVAAYRRKLGHMPVAQVNWLADQVLERCEWFPTIAECLTIAAEWQRDDEALREYRRAETALFWERQRVFDDTMAALRARELAPDAIAALPEAWLRAAHTYGHIYPDADAPGGWIYAAELRARNTAVQEQAA
ncbi:hypothetical protein GTZ99_12380 [Novosphingobium sp. FSY-8]|uniref:Uncharacterized protein n=1 Tax=Novosphingobium ovatum TaxID=1908523 RepID=A0ABW9XFM4_9SPHN|nr:hypothetical protein [Novosphingobium ovatum]NBC37347.1 hypothetical protein [Novosphingobium ovatum]